MKKRIGELNGHPIVIGCENEVTINELHYSVVNNAVVLKKRLSDGSLTPITAIAETPKVETVSTEDDEDNDIKGILD